MANEDTLVLPDQWRRYINLRRDRPLLRTFVVDGAEAANARATLVAAEGRVRAVVEQERTDARVAEAARACLAGVRNALGAAAVLATGQVTDRELVQDWIERQGPAFAAAALVEFNGLMVSYLDNRHTNQDDPRYLRFRQADERVHWQWRGVPLAETVRFALACADDEEYAAAVEALAGRRTDEMARLLASFLLPTEQAWTDELIAQRQQWGPVGYFPQLTLSALTTVEQLTELEDRLVPSASGLYTLVHTIGAEVAPLLVAALDADPAGGDTRKLFVSVLGVLPTDEALGALVSRAGQKHVQSGLIPAMKRFPSRALRLLAAARSGAGEHLLAGHLQAHPELLDVALPDNLKAVVDRVAANSVRVPDASPETLPPVLVSPPWAVKRAKTKPVVLTGLEPPAGTAVRWLPGEQKRWHEGVGAREAAPDRYAQWSYDPLPRTAGREPDWTRMAELMRSYEANEQSIQAMLVHGPEDVARTLLDPRLPLARWDQATYLEPILARFEADAVPMALSWARESMTNNAKVLLPFANAEIAALMVNAFARLKSLRGLAVSWFERHGAATIPFLVPAALAKAGGDRRAAESAIRLVVSQTSLPEVLAQAEFHGPEARAAIETLAATDPIDVLPAKMPVVGDWAAVDQLPQIKLRDGAGLPRESTGHLLTMLAMSRLDEVYAGVPVVRELARPDSLAEFGWALFQQWRLCGENPKDGWALSALGLLGDDDTVRRLSPIIRAWPGEGGHSKAVTGLDVLSAIGTDVALMHLSSIAQKVKFKALKQRAQDKITAVADDLGLTAEQLADRLVPSFGLDDAATLRIDYGPRSFTVGFDEQLKPYVLDQDGKRRKDLPRPGAKDDPELAPAEHARFAALRKDVRTVAADQLARLELAMVRQREWTAAEFTGLLAGHPLLWHIVRRLVWVDDAGAGFRVAEDRSFADVNDDPFTLGDQARVRLAHPLDLGDDLAAWSELFADYEILQPFPQLGRPVYTLTDEEKAATALKRFEGVTVPVGKVLGLTKRSWQRTEPQDAGVEWGIVRPSPGGVVLIWLDPGIAVGAMDVFPEQKLGEITLGDDADDLWRPRTGLRVFGELDPITASELVAELTDLTS